MATSVFSEEFGKVMEHMARDTIISEYCWMQTKPFEPVSDATRKAAEAFYDNLVAEGKVMAYMEATAAKPCPECGRV